MNTKPLKPTCQIITTKPTVENVIPYAEYKKTQPRFQDANLLNTSESILLGGGRQFILGLLNSPDPTNQKMDSVELFILNSCIIFWFNILGHGLQIPFTSVLYHASKQDNRRKEGHTQEILLTLERDNILNEFFPVNGTQLYSQNGDPLGYTMSSVELIVTPKYSMYDRYYNDEIETLFTFPNFGMNRGDDLVKNCNDALALGMELHGNEFDDEGEDDEDEDKNIMGVSNALYSGIGDVLQNNNVFHNSGSADDLDNDVMVSSILGERGPEAGMSVEFYQNRSLAGRKNPRSE